MGIGKQAKVITFIHTRDREKSKAFYRDVLGFSITADDPFGTVVDLNGISLRITPIENHTPNPHTVLGWQVPDIAATIDALAAKGVKMIIYPGFGQDEKGIWTSPDGKAKVCFFHDPDGNGLSLTQS
jgi:catechol 2,3-dioxygenase-like lactoylglutathione lyase family enzyme